MTDAKPGRHLTPTSIRGASTADAVFQPMRGTPARDIIPFLIGAAYLFLACEPCQTERDLRTRLHTVITHVVARYAELPTDAR